ncbi:Fur family transcriptional regulator [Acinetobacter nematophilus]|uniref:Transcriptional repressor n=1 Tax=Acinetobacter nematophilus TaxID=2994642 RepID=A0A9X3DWE6_9GAMM|nr:transcriptional repressor [Acinetobacter nematophilus]MCX5466334.1 transcriptional repressor [Acinetobacter nematophilus]
MEIFNPYKNIEELKRLLLQANLKVTTTRLTVLNILKNARRELTAAEILYNPSPQVKKLSFAGVYQTLRQLEEAGVLVKFKLGNEQALYSFKDCQSNIRICCKKCGHLQLIHDQDLELDLQALILAHGASTCHLTLEKSECLYCKG